MSKLRQAARDQSCIRCGSLDGVVLAHYSGRGSHQFGNGMGCKSSDVAAAHLCTNCHTHMDSYADGNTVEREAEFLRLCVLTTIRLFEQGVVK